MSAVKALNPWSPSMRPAERRENVRAQLERSAAILAGLAGRRDMTDAAWEMELRMQVLWLTNAAGHWHQAELEEAEILRVRGMFLEREGPGGELI